ncbi:MAG: UDP-N-acetylmuramoyl-L-alanine--D-glutamate ligase [Bryobacteraceae bacterium]
MTTPQIDGARVLVVGLERSGLAAIDLLLARGAKVRATDTAVKGQEFLKSRCVRFDLQADEVFKNLDLIVISPGVPADLPQLVEARRQGVDVIGEVELAGRFLQGRVIGITGSNGKTTTTALAGHILRFAGVPVQVGGNIGTAVASLVESSRPDQWNVVEISSFQLETIRSFRADIAVCLNVTPDHLDRHYTFAGYAAAKGRIFETQRQSDYAILNADDATCVDYSATLRARPVWFSSSRAMAPGIWLDNGRLWMDDEMLMEASAIPIRGLHNVENTMAAAVAARLAGVSLAGIAAAVSTFRAVEHRLEFVSAVRGVDYYNDSKATNVDATLKALAAFDGSLWVILGGKDKGSDYRPLNAPLRKKAHAVLLIGAASETIAAQLDGGVPVLEMGTLDRAVKLAHRRGTRGDTVLLAPACASFDQFDNYEHRGRVFKSLVKGLEVECRSN